MHFLMWEDALSNMHLLQKSIGCVHGQSRFGRAIYFKSLQQSYNNMLQKVPYIGSRKLGTFR